MTTAGIVNASAPLTATGKLTAGAFTTQTGAVAMRAQGSLLSTVTTTSTRTVAFSAGQLVPFTPFGGTVTPTPTPAPIVPAPYVPPAVPIPPLPGAGATWTFAVGAWNTIPDTELPTVTGRTVTFQTVGAHTATFTIDGLLPETAQIQELVSDLWVLRNGVPLFRGRVGATSDSGDGSSYPVSVNAVDYREVLRRRVLYDGGIVTYTNADRGLVAWSLIAQTQSNPGGNLGISRGVGQTVGVADPTTVFTPGSFVGQLIDQLAVTNPGGFEYDLTPVTTNGALTSSLTYDMWPQRGADRRVVIDHPGRIASFTRTADPTAYGNAIRMSGANGVAPTRVYVPDVATRPEGRWDLQLGDTAVQTQPLLQARGQQELSNAQLFAVAWQVTLEPDVWQGPQHIWLGDPVTIAVQAGRLNVVESLRVMELQVAIDDSGAETVTLVLGAPHPDRRWNLRRVDRRLTALERR